MLHILAYILCHMFFKRIIITGKPYTGKSALWGVNHSNGIVDPTLMLALAPVFLRPLAKATLWNNPVMRIFLSFTQAIAVARPQDAQEMFQGRAVDPDWMKKVNAQAFQKVNKALREGSNILIFPEGLSHDDPFLHPFKTGIARMAIQAVAGGAKEITIQPLVIDYSEKNEYQSVLSIHYCDTIVVTSKDTVVSDIMNKFTQELNKYYVNCRTWDEKRNWIYIFKIFYGRAPQSLEEFHDFVISNCQAMEQDPVLLGKIQTMRCMLQAIELSPCDKCWRKEALKEGQNGYSWFFMFIFRILSFCLFTVPIKFLNTLIWGVPLAVCEFLGTSKKYNRDVYATMKIAHAMWVFPLWAILVVGGMTIFTQDYFPSISPILLWFMFFISAPLLLLIGRFFSEHLNFCAGYFRFGLLKLTFPRGLEEMMSEWKEIADGVIKTVKPTLTVKTEVYNSKYTHRK